MTVPFTSPRSYSLCVCSPRTTEAAKDCSSPPMSPSNRISTNSRKSNLIDAVHPNTLASVISIPAPPNLFKISPQPHCPLAPSPVHELPAGSPSKDDIHRSPAEARTNEQGSTYLGEPNILALLPETLTADIETVFANETGFVGANATGVDDSISR